VLRTRGLKVSSDAPVGRPRGLFLEDTSALMSSGWSNVRMPAW
jgi:hypothetical protein